MFLGATSIKLAAAVVVVVAGFSVAYNYSEIKELIAPTKPPEPGKDGDSDVPTDETNDESKEPGKKAGANSEDQTQSTEQTTAQPPVQKEQTKVTRDSSGNLNIVFSEEDKKTIFNNGKIEITADNLSDAITKLTHLATEIEKALGSVVTQQTSSK